MKIVLFGATGNLGRQVAGEALSRGHAVVGVVRDPAAVAASDSRVRLANGDATKADTELVQGADAVVSAISPRPNSRGLAAPSLVENARAPSVRPRKSSRRARVRSEARILGARPVTPQGRA